MTEEELAAIEARAKANRQYDADAVGQDEVLALVAEVRRLRPLALREISGRFRLDGKCVLHGESVCPSCMRYALSDQEFDLRAKDAEIERLRGLLKPFAEAQDLASFDFQSDDEELEIYIPIRHFRAAAAALK